MFQKLHPTNHTRIGLRIRAVTNPQAGRRELEKFLTRKKSLLVVKGAHCTLEGVRAQITRKWAEKVFFARLQSGAFFWGGGPGPAFVQLHMSLEGMAWLLFNWFPWCKSFRANLDHWRPQDFPQRSRFFYDLYEFIFIIPTNVLSLYEHVMNFVLEEITRNGRPRTFP